MRKGKSAVHRASKWNPGNEQNFQTNIRRAFDEARDPRHLSRGIGSLSGNEFELTEWKDRQMKNPSDVLIWQGRIHLGDEPGVYGDASYSGLCMELPMTFHPFDPTSPNEDLNLELEAEDVNVYTGYPGHLIT